MEQKSINAESNVLDVMLEELQKQGMPQQRVIVQIEGKPRTPLYQHDHHGHAHDHGHHHHDFDAPDGELLPVEPPRRRLPPGCILGFKVVYGVLYVIVDSNFDAFIFDEMIEYFTGEELHCLLPWLIGFSWNVIPNIPWSIAILSVIDQRHLTENQHRRSEADGHDHNHDHSHDSTCAKLSHVLGDIGLFVAASALAFASSVDTINKFHVAIQMSQGINGTEVANIWTNCSPLNHTGIIDQAPRAISIPISVLAAMIRGYGDFKLHSIFFHAAGNPIKQFKKTMWKNIWLREDHGIPWKLLITFAKLNIIVAHFGLGFFIKDSIIDVFNLETYLPGWLSNLCGIIPGLYIAVFEAITETFCIDRILGTNKKPAFDTTSILLLTKISLIISALIHTLPVALEFSTWTHQSPTVIYNVLLFMAYMITFSASSYGFYATTINYTYDDIIRRLACRPFVPADGAEPEIPKPDRRCCGFFRRRADRAPLLVAPAEQRATDDVNNNNNEQQREDRGWCGIM